MRGFPILILICEAKIKMWVEKRACLRILPMTFIGRIGIMREMVNIPMVVIILFSEMWNTMKIGIRILIKRVI